jgi:TolB-like protein
MDGTDFLVELKRRNVYKVAIVYSGIAWLLLQLASVTLEPLGIPAWAYRFVILLIAMGFPFALLFAWALELTPQGLRREAAPESGANLRTSISQFIQFILVALLCLLVGYAYLSSLLPVAPASTESAAPVDNPAPATANAESPSPITAKPSDPAPGTEPPALRWTASIAVLPFVNMSADADNEYFSDGISEQLLHTLAGIKGLKVPARTSSFHFKGKNQDIRTIGETLGVEHVLEGSVRKAGDRVRITAQLIQVADGAHLWSETYDRQLEDIFALQDEIALAIAVQLELHLGLHISDSSAMLGTRNVDAYEAYLRGVHAIRSGISPQNIQSAMGYARQALTLDPDFAYAHALLAAMYNAGSMADSSLPVADKMAVHYNRALELDPTNPIALSVKARTELLVDWDWQKLEVLLRRAQENGIDGFEVPAQLALNFVLPLGRVEEARRLFKEARELDPLNRTLDFSYLVVLFAQNDWPGVLDQLKSFPAMFLQSPPMLATFCKGYFELGDVEQVDTTLQKLRAIGSMAPQQVAGCEAHSHWLHGDRDAALAAYARRETLVRAGGISASYVLGEQALSLGEIERALDWFEVAFEQREQRIIYIRTTHVNDKELIAHPRYQALLQKMNLDDESLRAMGYL